MPLYGSGFFYFGPSPLPQPTEQPEFYGLDANGFGFGGPTELTAYQNNQGTVVLYWKLIPCSPVLDEFVWTVETDLVSTFDSSDFRSYTSTANPDYIDADIHKGISVPTYERAQGESRAMYWRVWGTRGGTDTNIGLSTFEIPEAVDQVARQDMLDTVPEIIFIKDFAQGQFQEQEIKFNVALVTGNTYDLNVDGVAIASVPFAADSNTTMAAIATAIAAAASVGSATVIDAGAGTDDDRIIVVRAALKDTPVRLEISLVTGGALQPTTVIELRSTSNLNRIYDALGQEIDAVNFERILTENDLFTLSVRDASLDANFGFKVDIQKPFAMKTIDFREIIRSFVVEVGASPSIGAVKRLIQSIYCGTPTLVLVKNTLDMYVDDPATTPAVAPFYVDDAGVDAPTIWDNQNLAFGVIVTIANPMGITLTQAFVDGVVLKLAPAHAPVYLSGI